MSSSLATGTGDEWLNSRPLEAHNPRRAKEENKATRVGTPTGGLGCIESGAARANVAVLGKPILTHLRKGSRLPVLLDQCVLFRCVFQVERGGLVHIDQGPMRVRE